MALKLNDETAADIFAAFGNGGVASSSPLSVYVKVEDISGTKHLIRCGVSLTGMDSAYRSSTHVEFTPNLEGPNFIKQAYTHLKTLPEFADAMDC